MNKNLIKLSIIIPIYNAEKYLERCIDSILLQSFQDFEIILVNDGSTDGSRLICEAYAKKDNRVILINKPNGGSSSAKNLGLSHANGEYIEFVDADDYLDEEYIEHLWTGCDVYDADVCIGNVSFTKIRNGDIKSKERVSMQKGHFTLKEFLMFYPTYMPKAIIGAPWNKIYKKEIIDTYAIKFDTQIRNNEDTHFNYWYLSKCSSVYVSDEPYYNYIDENVNSASRAYIPNLFDIYLMTYDKAIKFLQDTGVYEYNIGFQRQHFINLVIGAINQIVLCKNCLSKNDKFEQIKRMVNNDKVEEAINHIRYSDRKKQILLILMKKKYYRTIYFMILLNSKIKGKDTIKNE